MKKIIGYNTGLVISLIVLLGISLFCWIRGKNPGDIGDFGLNAFTEIIGIFITVFIVDRILDNRRKKELIPVELGMYREIQVFMSRLVSFWTDVYYASVPNRGISELSELFSEDSMKLMREHLDMEAISQSHSMLWVERFKSEGEDFTKRGNDILNRYVQVIDADAFRYIHLLLEDSLFIPSMITAHKIWSFDRSHRIPRPTLLGNYQMMFDNRGIESVNSLIELLGDAHKRLVKYDSTLHKVEKIRKLEDNPSPVSMMTEEKYNGQMQLFKEFQDKSKLS